jgi:hypothetical protein
MLTAVHYEEKHETRCIQPWPKLQYHSADTSDPMTFRMGVAYSIGNITIVIALARRITRINDPAFDGCHSVVKQRVKNSRPGLSNKSHRKNNSKQSSTTHTMLVLVKQTVKHVR